MAKVLMLGRLRVGSIGREEVQPLAHQPPVIAIGRASAGVLWRRSMMKS